MQPIAVGRPLGAELLAVVTVVVRGLAEHVEAVDLVEGVDIGEVVLFTETSRCGCPDALGRVLADTVDVLGRDGDGAQDRDFIPRRVDLWARRHAVEGRGILAEQGPVKLDGLGGDVDPVQHRRFRLAY